MNNVKEYSVECLSFQLLLFVLFLALILLSIDQNLEQMDINAILSVNCLISQATFNTLSSYFSDKVRSRSADIAWIVYDTRWYQMPMRQQVFVQWIARRAQKPFVITGAKIISSSMETMAKVCIFLLHTIKFITSTRSPTHPKASSTTFFIV